MTCVIGASTEVVALWSAAVFFRYGGLDGTGAGAGRLDGMRGV